MSIKSYNLLTSEWEKVAEDPIIASSNQVLYQTSINTKTGSTNLTFDGTRLAAKALTVNSTTLHVDSANGRIGIGTTSPTALIEAVIPSNTTPGVIIRGAASQSANFITFQNNSNTQIASITSSGRFVAGNSATTTYSYIDPGGSIGMRSSGNEWTFSYGSTGVNLNTSFGASGGLIPGSVSTTAGRLDTGGGGLSLSERFQDVYIRNFSPGFTVSRFGTASGSTVAQLLTPVASGTGLIIRANATNPGNLQEWQNSSNTVLASISNTGSFSTSGDLTVGGNLTINGTTTTFNSTTVTIDDPIFTLGGDTAPTVDDNKDRGIEFRWHNGTSARIGFFGLDDSTGKFTFIPDATNTSEVFSGTKGTIDANIEWADVLNKPDPVITVTLQGDIIGNANTTLTDLSNGTVTVNTTIAVDATELGAEAAHIYSFMLMGA